jgi:hypothetical protein
MTKNLSPALCRRRRSGSSGPKPRLLAAAFAVCAIAMTIGVAGCGGSGSADASGGSTATTTRAAEPQADPTGTKPQWVASSDAICLVAAGQSKPLFLRVASGKLHVMESAIGKLGTLVGQELQELQAVPFPKNEAAGRRQWLNIFEERADDLAAAGSALEGLEKEPYEAAAREVIQDETREESTSKEIGFKACGLRGVEGPTGA